ncbi:MAG: T9SS type A sorting domain-containing protein [Flavobacteriales bacterium]
MRTEKKLRSLTAFASLGIASLMNGQSGGRTVKLEENGLLVDTDIPEANAPGRAAPRNTPTVVPITDDGRNEDYAPTAQFIVSLTRAVSGTVAVDVLNETGEVLRMQTFTAKPGHSTIAIDVSRFPQGRYALRVLSGSNASVTRFRRD